MMRARTGTLENESIDDVRIVMEVNFFGVVALTRTAFPYRAGGRRWELSAEGAQVVEAGAR